MQMCQDISTLTSPQVPLISHPTEPLTLSDDKVEFGVNCVQPPVKMAMCTYPMTTWHKYMDKLLFQDTARSKNSHSCIAVSSFFFMHWADDV